MSPGKPIKVSKKARGLLKSKDMRQERFSKACGLQVSARCESIDMRLENMSPGRPQKVPKRTSGLAESTDMKRTRISNKYGPYAVEHHMHPELPQEPPAESFDHKIAPRFAV